MDENGTIRVRVFTGRAQIPLEDATVAITQTSPDGRHRLIAVRVTGESGEIDPVAIPAPAAADSTSPGAAEAPFSVCDVWAEHPLYELLTVEDVQIFAGVETLQEMKLIPLPENTAPRDAAGEVRVTPQDL